MRSDYEEFDEKESILPKILLAVGFLAVAIIAYFLWQSSRSGPSNQVVDIPLPTPAVETQAPIQTEPEPVVETPAEPAVAQEPAEPPPPPLPELDNSDGYVMEALTNLPVSESVKKLLVPDNVLRKTVRMVMALDEGIVVRDYRPVQSPAPGFKVRKIDEPLDIDVGQRYVLDESNYDRYAPWVSAFAAIDKKAMVGLYKNLSPLLEEAYQQHGVDRGSFHNVIVSVVDNLLAAPIYEEDLVLVQPKVFYQYENTEIEKLPQAHRLMVRMGPENTRKIQDGLKIIKQQLQTLDLPTKK